MRGARKYFLFSDLMMNSFFCRRSLLFIIFAFFFLSSFSFRFCRLSTVLLLSRSRTLCFIFVEKISSASIVVGKNDFKKLGTENDFCKIRVR